jgi:hypothetical protein
MTLLADDARPQVRGSLGEIEAGRSLGRTWPDMLEVRRVIGTLTDFRPPKYAPFWASSIHFSVQAVAMLGLAA